MCKVFISCLSNSECQPDGQPEWLRRLMVAHANIRCYSKMFGHRTVFTAAPPVSTWPLALSGAYIICLGQKAWPRLWLLLLLRPKLQLPPLPDWAISDANPQLPPPSCVWQLAIKFVFMDRVWRAALLGIGISDCERYKSPELRSAGTPLRI